MKRPRNVISNAEVVSSGVHSHTSQINQTKQHLDVTKDAKTLIVKDYRPPGICNVGNTCYLSSAVTLLTSLPSIICNIQQLECKDYGKIRRLILRVWSAKHDKEEGIVGDAEVISSAHGEFLFGDIKPKTTTLLGQQQDACEVMHKIFSIDELDTKSIQLEERSVTHYLNRHPTPHYKVPVNNRGYPVRSCREPRTDNFELRPLNPEQTEKILKMIAVANPLGFGSSIDHYVISKHGGKVLRREGSLTQPSNEYYRVDWEVTKELENEVDESFKEIARLGGVSNESFSYSKGENVLCIYDQKTYDDIAKQGRIGDFQYFYHRRDRESNIPTVGARYTVKSPSTYLIMEVTMQTGQPLRPLPALTIDGKTYVLCVVVSRNGNNTQSGHYVTYCRESPEGDGLLLWNDNETPPWYCVNDSVVTKLDNSTLPDCLAQNKSVEESRGIITRSSKAKNNTFKIDPRALVYVRIN